MFGKNAIFLPSLSFGLSRKAVRVSLVIGVLPPSLGKSLVLLPGLVANFVHCDLLAEAPGGWWGAGLDGGVQAQAGRVLNAPSRSRLRNRAEKAGGL